MLRAETLNGTEVSRVVESAPLRRSTQDPVWVRVPLTFAALAVIVSLIVVPVIYVFYEALSHGLGAYLQSLWSNADTRHAIVLTLSVAPVAVALNTLFGIAAAWLVARFRFPGRTLFLSLIDLPFSVSPVVAGLVFVLLFGLHGTFGPWLQAHGFKVIYAWPGLVLATAFVTFPFVARELLPVMEAIGSEEELAAVSLGASGWQMFRRVTLPNIRWGLLYGILLCNARAIGEFGAVYVVSGHVAGKTDTVPLQIEKLVQDYDTQAAFALASLLTMLGIVTLLTKAFLDRRIDRRMKHAAQSTEETVTA
jgi:sulfate transport system permease protein